MADHALNQPRNLSLFLAIPALIWETHYIIPGKLFFRIRISLVAPAMKNTS